MSAEPLPVSVVIPAYCRPDLVRRAVASVLAQRPAPPAELIVVDDASDDDTAEAARQAGATVLVNPENIGEGATRNVGVGAASQPWIALLDSDDEWLPDHLATLWPLRDGHVLLGAACLGVGDGPLAGRLLGWPRSRPLVLRSPTDLVWPKNLVTPSGALVRRDALLEAGGFAERMPQAADLDTWLRVLERGTGIVSPEVGVLYRVHEAQISRDRQAMHAARVSLYARYEGRDWYDPRLLDRMAALHAWDDRDARALLGAVVRPQGAIGLLQTWRQRWHTRRASRRHREELAVLGLLPRQ
jgi:glycosyltransferase involved in cell wall biosynthesis